MHCFVCGAESRIDTLFTLFHVVGSGDVPHCPPCSAKARLRPARREITAVVIITPLFLLLSALLMRWALFNVWGAALVNTLLLPLHELGHALAAKAVGCKVLGITIGVGPKVFSRLWFGATFQLCAYPVSGVTVTAHPDRRFYRVRRAIMLLGGTGAVVMALVAGILLIPSNTLTIKALRHEFAPGWSFVLGCALSILWNLIPRTIQVQSGPLPSDGRALMQTGGLDAKGVDRRLEQDCTSLGIQCCCAGDLSAAIEWCERGLRWFPGSTSLLGLRAGLLLETGKEKDAISLYESLVDSPDVDPVSKALTRDTLAWYHLMKGSTEDLTQADRLSAEAYRDLPWVSHVKGGRGCVLVEIGRTSEGVLLVESVLKSEEEVWRKAIYLCHMAMAAAAAGAVAQAIQYLDRARKSDSNCRLLGRTSARIQPSALS